jgi:hypothetical protein
MVARNRRKIMTKQSLTKSLQLQMLCLMFLLVSGNSVLIRAQACVQPPPNLVSWWKGEGNATDVLNLNHGTLQNGTTFVTGRSGQGFSFDGTNDAIILGNSSSLQPSSITIEGWINMSDAPTGLENVFAKWGFDASVDSYLLGVINSGGLIKVFGATGDGATGDPGLAGGDMAINIWNHIAMTYNDADGTHKLYQNGVEVASRVRPGGIFPTTSIAYFGREDSSELRFFSGIVDELSVYSRALSQAEIQLVFNAGASGKCQAAPLTGRFSPRQKLQPTSPVGSSGFGYSVAISGDTMVVGANLFDTTPSTGINIGKAYVFLRSGSSWTQQAELQANDGLAGDEFGYSVAISGDTIVVGSWRSNAPTSNSGAAYVFVRSGTTWTQQRKLTASDGAADDEFGNAVAISGDRVAVGSHSADQPNGGGHAGAVYIYNRSGTTWSETQKLIPTGSELFGDFLGESVAISGDTLVAGSSGDQEPSRTNRGSVYVYALSGGSWIQQQKLVVPDSQPSTQLGASVAIDGDTIVSGALGDTPVPGQPNFGAAYVFARSGGSWAPQQRLTASDGTMSDFFGWSVAVRGDAIVVGARHDDTAAGSDAGSAYVFNRSGTIWTEKQKLAASDAAAGDRLGTTTSLNADGTLVVGAPEKNLPAGQGNGAGALYVFNIAKTTILDFDGDGKSDLGIFRPSVGEWWLNRSSNGSTIAFGFGVSSDVIVPGDYTGDGKTDVAIWRPATGEWFVLRSEDSSFFSFPFGASGDVPAPADFDGDGKTDPATFRPTTGTWFISRSTGGVTIAGFGSNGDRPVAADYDGDGKADLAIFRPSVGEWWINRSTAGTIAMQFGQGSDKSVPGDFTGDGKVDVAFWRPSTGEWFVLRSEDSSYFSFPFGVNGDLPVAGDYDGDGKSDPGIFRPSNATWFISRSTGGTSIAGFGSPGDLPVPGAYVR